MSATTVSGVGMRLVVALCLMLLTGTAIAETGYYRYPAMHRDTLVFTAEGDLWTVHTDGGTARRLTTHPAEESQSALSPDGRLVAFVAAYDGAPDVYVMELDGAAPKRLSFDGGRVFVQGFAPDGGLLYASENTIGPSLRRVLRKVDPHSGATTELPLADANEAAFDADGKTLWFTRYGLHVTGDNAREYRGGAAAQLWRWSIASNTEATRVAADFSGGLSRPMHWQDRLYAIGELDGVANLWSMRGDGSDRRALTRHADFDVRSATQSGGRIVYQHGADLRIADLAAGTDRIVPIRLASDFDQRRERHLRKPLSFVSDIRLAPAGDRVVIGARGKVALAGLGALRRIEVAAPAATRLRAAVAAADGKSVFAIVDRHRGSEIWQFPADGSPGALLVGNTDGVHRWRLHPSPDGRWLAHEDKLARLWLLDLRSGQQRVIDQSAVSGDDPREAVVWSSDSRWLAITRADSGSQRTQLLLLEADGERRATLTSDRYESFSPAFSPDGRWLYFLSNRNFQATPSAPWGDRNTGALFNQRARVYALALQPGLRFPFQPRDELAPRPESNGKAAADAAAALPMLTIDGLSQRLFEVPIAPGNYRGLGVDRERLYTIVSGHLVCGVRTLGLRYPRAGPTRAPGRGPSA